MRQLALFDTLAALSPDALMQELILAPDDMTLLNEAARRGWPETMTAVFCEMGYKRRALEQRIAEARAVQRHNWQEEVAALERRRLWVSGF